MLIKIIYFVLFLFIFIFFLKMKRVLDKRSDELNPGRTVKTEVKKLENLNKLFVRVFLLVLLIYTLFVAVNLIWDINLYWLQIGLTDRFKIIGIFVGSYFHIVITMGLPTLSRQLG